MVIDEGALVKAIMEAYKGPGYKVAARIAAKQKCELVISAPDWVAIIQREHVPRKVLGRIVEHLGELPVMGTAFQVQKKQTQAEIFDMAVPETVALQDGTYMKRTQISYNGHQIWQRSSDLRVYMVDPALEDMMSCYSLSVLFTEDTRLAVLGSVSQLYIKPLPVMHNALPVLEHLSKLSWV